MCLLFLVLKQRLHFYLLDLAILLHILFYVHSAWGFSITTGSTQVMLFFYSLRLLTYWCDSSWQEFVVLWRLYEVQETFIAQLLGT